MAIEIVDLPIKHGDFPVRYVVYQRVTADIPSTYTGQRFTTKKEQTPHQSLDQPRDHLRSKRVARPLHSAGMWVSTSLCQLCRVGETQSSPRLHWFLHVFGIGIFKPINISIGSMYGIYAIIGGILMDPCYHIRQHHGSYGIGEKHGETDTISIIERSCTSHSCCIVNHLIFVDSIRSIASNVL